ncbi:MAG: antA/AntB antirepressor family protein [Vagococcus sp.]|uniref:antA/AntB antirepressor family protein n=1 Tax=Vagococcus sp. TaxID=1933889 RepID=UPI002FC9D461
MNQLIKVTTNENGDQLTSGRELYVFLEVTERYSSWFERILKYGFTENVDFVGCKVFNALAKQELQDHALTLDMAKEISMIQRSEKGKQARQYFIKVEKEHKQFKIPTNPMEVLELTFAAQKNTDKKVDQVVERVTELEENVTIDPGDYGYLTRRINKAVFQELEIKRFSKHKQQVDLFYKDINKGIHEITGVKTRSKLKQKQFDAVDSFITNWTPSTATITLAEQIELLEEVEK